MCGLAGFHGRGDVGILQRMTNRLVHRGPDDSGFFHDATQAVHFGFRRLAILDLPDGKQPMSSIDGALTVVFNGEIYNAKDLRTELERSGAVFQTNHSDTEVLLHAYRRWGEDLVDHLDGMWAFVIHDRSRRSLFLSRDRFGKKPLFWFHGNDSFVFASELSALQEHPSVPRQIDRLALKKYFAYGFVPAPLTFLDGVRKLPAGHHLTFALDSGETRIRRYWHYQPEPFEQRPADAEQRWSEELIALLDAAVARRMVADVPVGCFLSGGIDSSLVATLAARHAGSERLKLFSMGFREASFDETEFAKIAALPTGAEHLIKTVSVDDALAALPNIRARWDEPIADSSLLPTYLLSGFAREHVTVALGGDGADELFAGYDPFKALRYANWYQRLVPRPIHRGIAMLAAKLPVSHRYMSFDFRLKRILRGVNVGPALRLPTWMAPLSTSELEELFKERMDPESLYSEAIEAWDECDTSSEVEKAITFYIRLYLQDDILVKVDRASMLHSLEVRAPFLDRALVDFARRLPADCKFRGGTTKYLLRRAARHHLPKVILKRRKQGFALPVGQWFAQGRLGSPATVTGSRGEFWRRQLAEQCNGVADHRLYLWSETALAHSTLPSTHQLPESLMHA